MGFRDELAAMFREANKNDGPDIFAGAPVRKAAPQPGRTSGATLYSKTDARTAPRGWGYWFLLAAVAILAYGFGTLSTTTAIPERGPNPAAGEWPGETVTVTVTVTKEVKVTQQVPTLPQACADALQVAADLEKQTPTIVNAGEQATDILKDARIAITEKDHQALNKLGSKINTLKNDTSAATQNLHELQDRLAGKLDDCNHALGR